MGWIRNKLLDWMLPKGLSAEDLEFFFIRGKDSQGPFKTLQPRELEDFYSRQAIVYSCIRLITTSALQAPPQVGVETDEGFVVDKNHDIAKLLRRPNPEMSYAEFLMYHIIHLLTTGKSFIWEWRDASGKISELWPLPTSWVEVIAASDSTRIMQRDDTEKRIVDHFIVTSGGQSGVIDTVAQVQPQDMTYTRLPHPDNFIDGVGPLQAATRALQMDEQRENYIKELLENTPFPGLVLTQEGPPDQEQKDAVRARLMDRIGKSKRGSALFLYGQNTSVDVPTPLSDLDWKGMSNLNEANISAAFGVPAILSGARVGLENSPWSNTGEAKKIFFETTMIAFWLFNAASWTRGLLFNEGDDINVIRHDVSVVKALQENMVEQAAKAVSLYNGGLIRRNEGRAMVNLEPDDIRGEVYAVPAGIIETPANEPIVPVLLPPPGNHLDGARVTEEEGDEEDETAQLPENEGDDEDE